MTHNARLALDTAYIDGASVPVPSGATMSANWYQQLDTAQFKAVDGDAGGTWSPGSAIQIAGAGIWCAGPWTVQAAANAIPVSSAHPITFGDSDYFVLGSGHAYKSRTIITSCDEGVDASGANGLMAQNGSGLGMGDPRFTGSAGAGKGRLLVPLRVHNGARFVAATFYFSIVGGHGSLPQWMPAFRLFRVDLYGNAKQIGSGSAYDPSGQGFLPSITAVSVGAYQALTSWTYAGFAGGELIDTSQFAYFADILDETGTNSLPGNKWFSVAMSFDSIADTRPQ